MLTITKLVENGPATLVATKSTGQYLLIGS